MSNECPKCCGETRVTDSRARDLSGIIINPGESAVYRRRQCRSCGWRYSTCEITDDIWKRLNCTIRNLKKERDNGFSK